MTTPVPPFDGTQVCAQVDPEVFHPEAGGQAGATAKALCRTCPLVLPCLEYALAVEGTGPRFGVWGGLSAVERRVLARHRATAQRRRRDQGSVAA